ncbi:hypothetical protein [Oxalicibacterium solurbis]|uniref:Uncharacterized protein n=1 Tax=Oxalicibacterium solurbis TaxID=69280 RepID=A0A8J3F6C6_9BURK|nr:hypothetical protein [Oxalicibacterium solurbis]GGI54688.1 hypothetical protein GCM10011430_18620 [Oxalicibacterium solurbis]
MANKPARFLNFKCAKCSKSVQVRLQKVSACTHLQPYQGICDCGELRRHATGDKTAVEAFVATGEIHHHHHH